MCDPRDDYKEDTRPQCKYCNEHYTQFGILSLYCSLKCWHLNNLGGVKAQILLWLKMGNSAEKILYMMKKYDWFAGMTDSTVNRWTRAISAITEV
jgi:hypothetical protein